MKIDYVFRKIVLMWVFLLLVYNAKAQNSCNSAVNLQLNACTEYQFQNAQYYWFTFTADTVAYEFSVVSPINFPANVTNLYLYADSCDDLTLKKTVSAQQYDDIAMIVDSLVQGTTYHLCVKQDSATSNYFKLCTLIINHKSWTPSQCPPPMACPGTMDLIGNGGFAPNQIPWIPLDPFQNQGGAYNQICGWYTAWGTPQVYTGGTEPGFPVLPANQYAAYMWSAKNQNVNDPTVVGEAIYQNFNFGAPLPSEKYVLTMDYACTNIINLNVYLSDDNLGFYSFFPYAGYGIHDWGGSVGDDYIVTQNHQLSATGSNWQNVDLCIGNLPDYYNKLVIYPTNPNSFVETGLAIRNVQLIKYSFEIVTAPTTIDCGESVNIETRFCPEVGAGVPWTFIWSNGATSPNIIVSPATTTTYTVTATSCGFTFSDEVTITVNPFTASPVLAEYVNNLCKAESYEYPYSIINAVPGVTYVWTIVPMGAGYFNGDPNMQTAIGTSVTITWDPGNIPPLPDYATIVITALPYNDPSCAIYSTYRIFECCDPYPNDPPQDLIVLNNTDAVTAALNSSYSNAFVVINGNFHINRDLAFTTTFFDMGPEASIIIDPGYSLTIDQTSYVRAGCGFMWKGIDIADKKSRLLFKSSEMRDAYSSINASNEAEIKVLNSVFVNNDVALHFKNYDESGNGIAYIMGNSFTSSLLNGSISFLPPLDQSYKKPYAGIIIENSIDLTIGDVNYTSSNIFSTMYHGIISKYSDIKVIGNEFSDIHAKYGNIGIASLYEPFGVGIYSADRVTLIANFLSQGIDIGGTPAEANTFSYCDYGVYLKQNRRFSVSENHFDHNKTGIFASEVVHRKPSKIIHHNTIDNVINAGIDLRMIKGCRVQFNTISNINIPTSTAPSIRKYGIRAVGCLNTVIYNNDIYNSIPEDGFDLRLEGICVQGSTHTISCNSITKMGKAMAFYGANIPSTVTLNHMHDFKDGIYLNAGIIGQQGNEDYPSDNTWDGAFDNHANTENNTTTSLPFYVRDYGNPWWTNLHYPLVFENHCDLGSYALNVTGTSGTGSYCLDLPQERTPMSFVLNEATGQMINSDEIDWGSFDQTTRWLARNNLYDFLIEEDPALLTGWMNDFLNNYDGNDQSIYLLNGLLGDYDFNQAIALIGNTTAQSEAAENFLKVYKVVSEAALTQNNVNDDLLLYGDQLDSLRVIAQLCPYEAGDAVYLARTILLLLDPGIYSNICEDMIDERSMKQPENSTPISVTVYPSPAKDEFYVEVTGDIAGVDIDIKLYNIYGSLQKHVRSYSTAKTTVNTEDLPSGIYYYQVDTGNEQPEKGKIIIIK